MFRFRFVTGAFVAAVVALSSPATSEAAFKIRFDYNNDGTYEKTITDNSAEDSAAQTGLISYIGSVGGFNLVINVGTSKPLLTNGAMDLLNFTLAGTGTIAIEITDTGFTPGQSSPYLFSAGGTSTNRPGVTFQAGGTSSNTEFDLTTSTGVLGVTNGINNSFSTGGTFGPGGADPYSLTMRAVITHNSFLDATSFDAEVRPAPAPAGLVMALTALPFFGLLRRRMRETAGAVLAAK